MPKITKIFLDTEFTGLHKNTTLISLGLVSECGKTFYAEFTDYDQYQISGWIKNNVLANLTLSIPDGMPFHAEYHPNITNPSESKFQIKASRDVVKKFLEEWLSQFDSVQIWSDCLAYDWVLFNDIFGTAFDLPKNVSYIPMDICTLFQIKGIDPDISREDFIGNSVKGIKHNALYDAKVIKACYEKLMRIEE
jgi:hypothetical protein